jgi:nucleoside-diphosphate-sugar epimerase
LPSDTLIFGYGYSARRYVEMAGPRIGRVVATTRCGTGSPTPVTLTRFDGRSPGSEIQSALRTCPHVVVSIAPDDDGDPVLRWHQHDLARAAGEGVLKWICYLSTVGVYGDHGGQWVDETSPCRPLSARSKRRLRAETAWGALAQDLGLPLAIFRLAGIYGPGHNGFVNLAAGRAKRINKTGQVFNRIFVDDIASAIDAAASLRRDGLFNITDNEPAPPQDVVTFAAGLMGVDAPVQVSFEAADMTQMARSFYSENKRVSNAKARRELAWEPNFPTYRDALTALWERGNWRGGHS